MDDVLHFIGAFKQHIDSCFQYSSDKETADHVIRVYFINMHVTVDPVFTFVRHVSASSDLRGRSHEFVYSWKHVFSDYSDTA